MLLKHLQSGFRKFDPGTDIGLFHLAARHKLNEHLAAFRDADAIIIAFPLYVDCMPAIVKEFLEGVAKQEDLKGKRLGFIVQSGFPEAKHSTFVARYLDKFIKRYGFEPAGIAIKGGVEGIQMMPAWMTKKLFRQMEELGQNLAVKGSFDPELLAKMARPYQLGTARRAMFRFFKLFGLTDFYWNSNLKKNNAWKKRFDRPLMEKQGG